LDYYEDRINEGFHQYQNQNNIVFIDFYRYSCEVHFLSYYDTDPHTENIFVLRSDFKEWVLVQNNDMAETCGIDIEPRVHF
jgi:hypothetical protein